jgi:hypothetical protein
MSKIIGHYENKILNAKLVISESNDQNGKIAGNIHVGGLEIPISGVWNASTVAPNGLLSFTGALVDQKLQVGGAGQTANFNEFGSVQLGFSVAQKDSETSNVTGKFLRVA